MDAVTSHDFPPIATSRPRRTGPPRVGAWLLVALAACGEAPPEEGPAVVATTPAPIAAPAPGPAPTVSNQAAAATAAPDLLARRELGLDGRPLGLAAGDLDGDGYEDLVAVTESPGRLHVLRGGPSGLRPAASTDIGGFPVRPVLVPAPDGSQGILVASRETRQLTAYTLNGDVLVPALWQLELDGVPRTLHLAGPRSLCWLDRDGGLERLDWSGPDARLTEAPSSGARLQLDRDSRPVEFLPLTGGGLVVLCQGDRSLRLIDTSLDSSSAPGDPSGGGLAEVGSLPFDGVPRSAVEGDLDGDGDLEQAFFGGDRRVLVFGLGRPAGDFVHDPGPGLALEQPNLVPMAANARDLDGDGRDELVALGHLDQGYSVLGDFTPLDPEARRWGPGVAVSEYAGQDPWDLALGDFDGDGRPDLASACRGAGSISVLGGTGLVKSGKPAFHQAGRIGVGTNPLSIAAVDANGDGKPEVATLDAADGRLSLLANDGFGTLTLATRLAIGPSPRGLARLTAGGGEALVALSVPPGGAGRLVALGPGPAGFGLLELSGPDGAELGPLPPAGEAGLAVGDLDGDGDDDLALLDAAGGRVVVLRTLELAPGRLVLERVADLGLEGLAGPRCLALLQDTDGPRLAVGGATGVVLVDPEGGVTPAMPAPASLPGTRGCTRLAAADLDGDGDQDLVALWLGPQGTSPGLVVTRSRLADASFSYELPTGLAPADLVAGDLNGDGLAELVVAAQNSHAVDLWVNAGGAGFAQAPSVGVGLGPVDLCLVDLLGKGLADLVVANAFSADVSRVPNRPR